MILYQPYLIYLLRGLLFNLLLYNC